MRERLDGSPDAEDAGLVTDDRVPGVSEMTTLTWVCGRCDVTVQAHVKPSRCPQGHAGSMEHFVPATSEAPEQD